jgi:hypothetical protein
VIDGSFGLLPFSHDVTPYNCGNAARLSPSRPGSFGCVPRLRTTPNRYDTDLS